MHTMGLVAPSSSEALLDVQFPFRVVSYGRVPYPMSDEAQVLDTLPNKMKADLAIHVHLDTLCRVALFQVNTFRNLILRHP